MITKTKEISHLITNSPNGISQYNEPLPRFNCGENMYLDPGRFRYLTLSKGDLS